MLLAEYSQQEISQVLKLSYSRVHDIKRIIMEKWEVETMISLIKEAIKRGYLELEEDTDEDDTNEKPRTYWGLVNVEYCYVDSSKNKITIKVG